MVLKAGKPIVRKRGARKQPGDDMTIIYLGKDGQTAQSPDQNANDLAFYTSIDSSLPKPRERDAAKFEKQVMKAFKDYHTIKPGKLLAIFELKARIPQMIIDAKGMERLQHASEQVDKVQCSLNLAFLHSTEYAPFPTARQSAVDRESR